VDPAGPGRWLIDATPDFRAQLRLLDESAPAPDSPGLDGILLTHAHAGHYTGLLHLGREVMGTRGVPVHATARLRSLLSGAAPWSQLVSLGNIELHPLEAGTTVELGERLRVTPFLVPHRDEYSDTLGLRVEGPRRSVLYIPDIDKWELWATPLEEAIASVDLAYLDGTFFDGKELPGRDMSEIPHPFIVETMRRLAPLPAGERAKVRFLHLNHTNPALAPEGEARDAIEEAGFRLAHQGERVPL
jgi:pyrroloquinoline quinone biosynthesis protein B